eukprot:6629821-Prymnesium_polylepis.3
MESERIRYVSLLKTQISRSFRSRVGRLVQLRLRPSDEEFEKMTRAQKKERKCNTKLAMAAATSPRGSSGLQGQFAEVVDAVIKDVGIDQIELKIRGVSKSMSYVLKAAPTWFIPALRRINLALEAAGETRFRLVPLSTSNAPGFITICQRTLKVMGLVDKEQQTKINERIKSRLEKLRPWEVRLKELQAQVRELESGWKKEDFAIKGQRLDDHNIKFALDDMIAQLEGSTGPKRKRSSSAQTSRKRRAGPGKLVYDVPGSNRPGSNCMS